ncbi:MAG: flagellar basal body-associated FliL family protein [Nitrospinota bacterium]
MAVSDTNNIARAELDIYDDIWSVAEKSNSPIVLEDSRGSFEKSNIIEKIEFADSAQGDHLPSKRWIYILTTMILIATLTVVAFWTISDQLAPSADPIDSEKVELTELEQKQAKGDKLIFYDFDPFLIKIKDKEQSKLLTISLAAVVSKVEAKSELEQKSRLIREKLYKILQSHSYINFLESSSRTKLNRLLLDTLNLSIEQGVIESLNITEFYLQ